MDSRMIKIARELKIFKTTGGAFVAEYEEFMFSQLFWGKPFNRRERRIRREKQKSIIKKLKIKPWQIISKIQFLRP